MDQLRSETLYAIVMAVGIIIFLRFLPRIQAKIMGVPFISADDAKKRMDAGEDILVVDVRTADEFTGNLGHIQGALNLDAMALSDKLAKLGDQLDQYKEQPILITCRTHNRSPKAARVLFQHGFKKLMILDNGMSGWNRAGYPVAYKR